jgi:6-pyruvoyltetrahydropterin/6-carboxytetrahydropterin synthase
VFEVAYQTSFSATHRLTREGRELEPRHGHDWRVEVVASGEALDQAGVVVDFEVLERVVGEVVARLHHADLNDHTVFEGRSPSAEAVAQYLYEQVRQGLGPEGHRLARVRVWEAPGCSASYRA